jgi:hypothetical protein
MKEYNDPALEPGSRFTGSYDAETSDVYDDVDPFGQEDGHQVRVLIFQSRNTLN